MKRNAAALLALLVLATLRAARASEEASPADVEDAASVALHTAEALVHGHPDFLSEALDEPSLLIAAAGTRMAPRLTAAQRSALSGAMAGAVESLLVPRRRVTETVFVLDARPAGAGVSVVLLLPAPRGARVKTRWLLLRRGPAWKVTDIRLSDLGVSAVAEAVRSLADPPLVRLRNRAREARAAAWPRLIGILGVAAVAWIFARRSRGRQRLVVLAAAAGPLLVFGLDGALSVRRILHEQVELRLSAESRYAYSFNRFHSAAARGDYRDAMAAAHGAVAAGGSIGAYDCLLGRLASDLRKTDEAASRFRLAIAAARPAPGAWVGLARIAMERGDFREADEDLSRYFAEVAPDPDALAVQAVARGKLGEMDPAQQSVARAISLRPDDPDLYDLSARLAAGAGDAGAAVARLREEEKLRAIDRSKLASDPAFRSIASDPAWIRFLASPPGAPPSTGAGS